MRDKATTDENDSDQSMESDKAPSTEAAKEEIEEELSSNKAQPENMDKKKALQIYHDFAKSE